ncbi:MAG: hypothetical protein NVSMB48_14040 [Marmoricola sp.]|jgi:AcrR family transcriptional regulator
MEVVLCTDASYLCLRARTPHAAAVSLFSTRGFDSTAVDDIAERAGVERTFFRAFASKEAVILPGHDAVLASIEARLAASSPSCG